MEYDFTHDGACEHFNREIAVLCSGNGDAAERFEMSRKILENIILPAGEEAQTAMLIKYVNLSDESGTPGAHMLPLVRPMLELLPPQMHRVAAVRTPHKVILRIRYAFNESTRKACVWTECAVYALA